MTKFKFPTFNPETVQERFKEIGKGKVKETKDDRLYVLTKDKEGEGSSIIRFLPAKSKIINGKEQEGLPYSVIYRHNLQIGKGSFVSCICPTTVGGKCPICEWNKKMMDSDWVKTHNTYRKRKYLSNILVMEEATEDLKGQVKLFEYGAQIMNILERAIYPKRKNVPPLVYYDFLKGANFELTLSKEKGAFPSWETSRFLEPKSIMDFLEENDIDPESVYNKLLDTEEVVQKLKIESYDEIKEKLNEWCMANDLPILSDNPLPFKEENKAVSNRRKMDEMYEEENDGEETLEDESIDNEDEEGDEVPQSEAKKVDPKDKFKNFREKFGKKPNDD